MWSNWRGAVVVMLAWVGLAWSQAPMPTSSKGTGERIMTVHENGKSLRCRVLSTWRMADGSRAFQLQSIDSGEMITIVEDGPATTLQEPLLAGKVKSLPMRIFHWGRNTVAPPGVPTGPDVVVAAGATTREEKSGSEQVIWWEEKNGKRVSPTIVTAGNNPFEEQPRPIPSAKAPLTVAALQKLDQPSTARPPASVIQTAAVQSAPAGNPEVKMVTTAAGSVSVSTSPSVPVITLPGAGAAPRMATSAPALRTVVQTDQGASAPCASAPCAPLPTTTKPQAPYVRTGPTYLPNRINWVPANTTTTATAQAPAATPSPAPAMYGNITAASTPFNQIIPSSYGQPSVSTATAGNQAMPSSYGQTSVPMAAVSTTAAAAGNTKTADMAAEAAPRSTFFEKIGNWLHPKHDTTRPAEPKQAATSEKSGTGTAGGTKAATGPIPFSTAADPAGKVKTLPPPVPNPVASADPTFTPTNSSRVAPPTASKTEDDRSVKEPPVKKDWRAMWGRTKDTNVQVPGQSMVDQASGKPADILLTPEKFDPSGTKLTPRGINMNSYRGDPAQLMANNQSPTAVEKKLPGPSPLGPNDGRIPLGAQSVLAASGGAPGNTTYLPVPMVTVPQPNPPPLPPTKLPEPPQRGAYANAFTPPPPPQSYPMAPPYAAKPNMMGQGMPSPNYQGPQPPNPTLPAIQPPVQPIQYSPVPAPQPGANPAMDRRQAPAAAAGGSELPQIVHVLRESPYPAQREWASYALATYDWRAHPDIVQALLLTAQRDPAGTVRAACVYSLGRMNAASEPVVSLMHNLRNDSDPRVQQEVERALAQFGRP